MLGHLGGEPLESAWSSWFQAVLLHHRLMRREGRLNIAVMPGRPGKARWHPGTLQSQNDSKLIRIEKTSRRVCKETPRKPVVGPQTVAGGVIAANRRRLSRKINSVNCNFCCFCGFISFVILLMATHTLYFYETVPIRSWWLVLWVLICHVIIEAI